MVNVSDKTPEAAWNEAFAKAQGSMPKLGKNKTAKIRGKTKDGRPFDYSYSYADLADVIEAAKKPLADNGLSVAQDVQTQSGAVSVTTRIYHSAGHFEEFGPLSLGSGGSAQDAGGAITYARRYALCAALNIAADEDTDGAHAEAPKTRKSGESVAAQAAELNSPEGGSTRKDEPSAEHKAAGDLTPSDASPYLKALKSAVVAKRKHKTVTLTPSYVAHAIATSARELDLSTPPVPESQLDAALWRWIDDAAANVAQAVEHACKNLGIEPVAVQESMA